MSALGEGCSRESFGEGTHISVVQISPRLTPLLASDAARIAIPRFDSLFFTTYPKVTNPPDCALCRIDVGHPVSQPELHTPREVLVYSIVMLAAMSAAPETPDFCCLLKKNKQQDNGCVGYGYQQQYGYSQPNYGGGKGSFMGCNLLCCNKGQGGYGHGQGGGCNFLGCGLFGKFCGGGRGNGGGCNFLGCGLFGKFCGGGRGQGGYGDGYGGGYYGQYGQAPVILGYNDAPQGGEAEVVVNMPANAKLIANGQATEGNGSTRSFQTPTLAAGQDFRYEMKVEIEENGQTKTVTKQVTVRAGHRTTVDFSEQVNTEVTVTLPAKAKLLVDGTDTLMTGGTHTFKTPALAKGQAFSYKFRAEIEHDGKMEIVTQDVSFKAGEPVHVDFTKTTTVAK